MAVLLEEDVFVGSFFGFYHLDPPSIVFAYLGEFGTSPDLHGPVLSRLGEDQRSFALLDRDRPPELGGQADGVGAGRLVLLYAHPRREYANAYAAALFVLPGPHTHEVVA